MRKRIISLLALATLSVGLVACGNSGKTVSNDEASSSGDEIIVGFSQVGAESDWRTANTESMKSTFTEENGYKLIFDDAQQKQENQITAIRNFIQQEVDYVVLAPVTETGWDTVLQECKDAGIPVIIVDRMIDVSDDSLFTAWVGSDFRSEGDKAVDWMESKFSGDEPLNIVHIQGTIGSSAQIGRTEGLEAGAADHSNWNIVAQQTGEFTQAKGQEVMESVLKQNDDIDVVYCENDNEAFGAIDAIEAAGKTCGTDGDITVISFDATRAGLNETLAGKISYDVECNPLHGPRVEKIIEQLEKGETPDKLAYVDEETFDAATITQEIIDARAY
ncbi:MAG: ABC transporter substrate-binding protein [Clostridium sp.]|nr:ABC transporter substrate-binding protein [Clostridium sp.]